MSSPLAPTPPQARTNNPEPSVFDGPPARSTKETLHTSDLSGDMASEGDVSLTRGQDVNAERGDSVSTGWADLPDDFPQLTGHTQRDACRSDMDSSDMDSSDQDTEHNKDDHPQPTKRRRLATPSGRHKNPGPRVGGVPPTKMACRVGWPKDALAYDDVGRSTAPCVVADFDEEGHLNVCVHQMTENGDPIPLEEMIWGEGNLGVVTDFVGTNAFGRVAAIKLSEIDLDEPFKGCWRWDLLADAVYVRLMDYKRWSNGEDPDNKIVWDKGRVLVRVHGLDSKEGLPKLGKPQAEQEGSIFDSEVGEI